MSRYAPTVFAMADVRQSLIGRSQMISGEVPILFSKACELFIQDVTRKAYEHTRRCKRRTLNKSALACVPRLRCHPLISG